MNDKIIKWQDINIQKVESYSDTHNIYVILQDKKDKTLKQIKFMYVLLGEFAKEFYGETDEKIIEELKNSLYFDYCKDNNLEFYRTKTASVTDMKMFLDWLIKYMAQEFGITIALELIEEGFLNSWIYACTCNKICCICGKRNADIHHTKSIGIGKNRDKVDHTKYRVISLCRKHHTIEHETKELLKKHGLHGVQLNKYDFERLGIKGAYEEV